MGSFSSFHFRHAQTIEYVGRLLESDSWLGKLKTRAGYDWLTTKTLLWDLGSGGFDRQAGAWASKSNGEDSHRPYGFP